MYARVSSIIASAAILLAGSASAAPTPTACTSAQATVVVEASHGGAGSGLTNTTITVDIGTVFSGDSALAEVSSLYLTGASEGTSVDSIVCTPHQYANGTGVYGLPFTSSTPARLSTNTVVVGSITCALTN